MKARSRETPGSSCLSAKETCELMPHWQHSLEFLGVLCQCVIVTIGADACTYYLVITPIDAPPCLCMETTMFKKEMQLCAPRAQMSCRA